MHKTFCTILLVLALVSGATLAVEKSYMNLVGELLSMVEGAAMVRDACAKRSPSTAAANSRLHEGWATRHKVLLSAAREQIARANERLKKQGAPGEDPVEGMLAAGRDLLDEHLGKMKPAELKDYCGAYAELIGLKDREASSSIPQLLEVVTKADKTLSERELSR